MRNGLPNPVYWLRVVLFVVTIFWVFLYARDAMIGEEPLVAGRFGTAASLRLTASCFALMALTSGGPFGYYKRTDHYGSPLELFFRIVFGFSGAMAVIHLLPSLG
jgi:hypothetical protein